MRIFGVGGEGRVWYGEQWKICRIELDMGRRESLLVKGVWVFAPPPWSPDDLSACCLLLAVHLALQIIAACPAFALACLPASYVLFPVSVFDCSIS